MKKLLALLLALCMVLSLAACGEKNEKQKETASHEEKETVDAQTETAPAQQQEEAKKEEQKTESPYEVFEGLEAKVIDEDGITLTIGAPEADNWLLTCPVTLENNSKKKIAVSDNAFAINGKVESGVFFVEAEPGRKDTSSLYLYDLADAKDLTRMTMEISVTDENYDSVNYLVDIYPQGKDAYKQNVPERTGAYKLFDTNGVYAEITDFYYDDKEFCYDYVIINDSDKIHIVNVNTVAFNGFGVAEYLTKSVLPDTYAAGTVLSEEYKQLTGLGFSEVKSVTVEASVAQDFWKTEFDGTLTFYPDGEENDEVFKYTYDEDDVVLAENDAFKLTLVMCNEDYLGSVLYFMLENKTGGAISVDGRNMKINGKDYDSGWLFIYATDGRDAVSTVTVYNSDMTEAGIDEITSVEMTLDVRNEMLETLFDDTVKGLLN